MISAKPRRDLRALEGIVPLADAEPLPGIGAGRYIRYHGADYELVGLPHKDVSEKRLSPGEIVLSEVADEILSDGERLSGMRFRVANRLPLGEYSRRAEKAAKLRARSDRANRIRPVSVIANSLRLRRQSERVVQLGDPGTFDPMGAIDNRRGIRREPNQMYRSPVPAARGGAEIIDRYRARGITFTKTQSGKVMLQARRGRLLREDMADIERLHPLILAELSGYEPLCEADHAGKAPRAVDVVPIGVLACAAHAAGDEPADGVA